ncbi:Acyl-CoA dehydrogenase [Limihaloglobus sulfuriphilus]|uniref:Acyl-CoA dehydrogenase n=1 Tax=Limihaloglobus sulfuriphilus TaxID=1851148 RepID=A0A1Q2ME43_9BACT|nr:acyl-CoA dehydrogenase family protein [Limihaloglobus sulfuriphilus]AQQ70577.1 Acyl-CoA dehydrogenase [Limihaloglobus sulfuriphilus]
MANFYKDNDDIKFLLNHMDLGELADLMEQGYKYAEQFDTAPANAQDAIENYELVIDSLGQLCADFVAPRSEEMDHEGNELLPDGSVKRPKAMYEILDQLAKAQVMGMTLPHRFGGLNFPSLMLSVANEMVSRADASLMNIFGLQGIAETINFFADEELKQKYLPDLANGKHTGAMVLTEPDAGSDLQACKVKAFQDADGQWYVHGVKRFITNGCGEVLLIMARSEPEISDGRGLSLFSCYKSPTVHIRRLEDKLGIHASPTCEIFFDNTPVELVGERQRGLITYVMALMNGARIGISAQGLGIGEAAYRIARDYAASREQFGGPIEKLPPIRDLLINMKISVEESRSLLYEACRVVDHEIGMNKTIENPDSDPALVKETKKRLRMIKRYAAMLTPMTKYISTEMANQVASDSISVLGGSGYMRDYACERYFRDARITNIYEGTTQLQVVAAVRHVTNGTAEKYIAELAEYDYEPQTVELLEILKANTETMQECVKFIKERGIDYMDLYGRDLVDIAVKIIGGYLFCQQACSKFDMQTAVGKNGKTMSMKERKLAIAKRYINRCNFEIEACRKRILSGCKSSFELYEEIAGPVPELA